MKVKSRRSNDAFLEFSRADPTPNSSAYATTNMRDDTTQTRGAKWKLANINVPHGHGGRMAMAKPPSGIYNCIRSGSDFEYVSGTVRASFACCGVSF